MTWRNNDLDEEMQAIPSETTDLVRFQSQELDRVQRLEKQRHKSGAHLAQICTAFSAAYARLAEAEAGARGVPQAARPPGGAAGRG